MYFYLLFIIIIFALIRFNYENFNQDYFYSYYNIVFNIPNEYIDKTDYAYISQEVKQ
jgi:hypothetical protein